MIKAPERFTTARLVVQRPRLEDVEAIFTRYASDPDVTRYLSWPVHVTVDQTHAFFAFSEREWAKWPAGPYLTFARDDGRLLGSSGLAFEAPDRASTGYVFAKDAWGMGYATETLRAMVDIARSTGVHRLYALCHVDHRPSAHVLEKGGFVRERLVRGFTAFPNLPAGAATDVLYYALTL